MKRPFHLAKPPSWLGQATVGLLSITVVALALAWVGSSTDPGDDGTFDTADRARSHLRPLEPTPAPHAVHPPARRPSWFSSSALSPRRNR